MPTLLYTVQDLVNEVRSQIDEANQDSVSDTSDILPALNRAQLYAFDILARKYPEPILQHTVLTLVAGQAEYDVPEDIFEDRVLRIEINIPSGSSSTYREVTRVSYRELASVESAATDAVPMFYCLIGRKIRFVNAPSGTYNARMWSLRNPEKLVLPQGRITIVNGASNYVYVDSAGSSLTTESDELGSYVNLIDGQTGEIRGSMQIQLISDDNKITMRSTPTRTTVLNRDIGDDLATVATAADDYLAPIDGSCVPYYGQPTTNFLVQYAVAELTRKLGGDAAMEAKVLEGFEKQIERTWVGRETSARVKRKSQNWDSIYRYWNYSRK